jgi:hypothetical protein
MRDNEQDRDLGNTKTTTHLKALGHTGDQILDV